jgi:hypothetical protein
MSDTLAQRIGDARYLSSLFILNELNNMNISLPDDIVIEFLKIESQNICVAFRDGRRWNNSYGPEDYFKELYQHNFNNDNYHPYKYEQ